MQSVGGVCVVTARGRLDGAASGPFAERVQALVGPDRPKLLIDFTGIDFVSSAGLRVVLTLLKRVKSVQWRVRPVRRAGRRCARSSTSPALPE